jgi:hypothetical protein
MLEVCSLFRCVPESYLPSEIKPSLKDIQKQWTMGAQPYHPGKSSDRSTAEYAI